jgi:hypothetical protein
MRLLMEDIAGDMASIENNIRRIESIYRSCTEADRESEQQNSLHRSPSKRKAGQQLVFHFFELTKFMTASLQ